ncbi:MAG: hypothetical protein KJN82_07470 [Bacteroidia bacterium]|nr:hypothetical protein [Bacteroidia bacterium]
MNKLLSFTLRLVIIVGVAFALHILALYYLELTLFENKIVLSYVLNTILAFAIFGFLFKYRAKLKNYIGFLFLAGSLLKFTAFFILIYPSYKADGDISKLEFAAFFIPYLLCLVIETSSLVKWLNQANFSEK